MTKQKQIVLLLALLVTVVLLAGCGRDAVPLDKAGLVEGPMASDRADVDAAQAANALLLGNGLTHRGTHVYLKGVPLKVREDTLAKALPNKEVLYLALRYGTLPEADAIQSQMDALSPRVAKGQMNAADVISLNRLLCQRIETDTMHAWQSHRGPIARIRGKERTEEDWRAYLAKRTEKNKVVLVLQR